MSAYLQNSPLDEPVYQFKDRKRAEGKPYRVYMMASANKFLRIYYATVKAYLEAAEHVTWPCHKTLAGRHLIFEMWRAAWFRAAFFSMLLLQNFYLTFLSRSFRIKPAYGLALIQFLFL